MYTRVGAAELFYGEMEESQVTEIIFLHQLFYPSPKNILDLLQALDAANQLEMIPSVWEGQ